MSGRTLAHYEILEKLGEGGMGVVYKARDTHLDRFVAIKVLPPEKVADPDRKRRFVQEAKAASALNHPNIITIHDIAADAGADFIVMELVAGRALDAVIGRHGLKLAETLKYAVQIADALATAHEAGIIHRDLKPGNVMVTEKGQVKVLDFGLAKLTEVADPAAEATQTLRPEPAPLTEQGAVLGTVSYMSPEQTEGKKVDPRSDIFSFGSLLYEMVTGHRAFAGDSKMSTITAILRDDPKPVSQVGEPVPRELEKIINRCLRKDPDRRLQHMDDVKNLLEELKEESDSGKLLAGAPPAAAARRRFPAIAAALLATAAVAAGAAWWWSRRTPPPPREPELTRLTSDSGLTTDPALSPDGKLLAYASDRAGQGNLDIWVRHVSGGEPVRLTTDPADDHNPTFSPDGSQIAFRSERNPPGVYVLSSLGGGDPRLLVNDGRDPRYSPDGKWIACWVGELTGKSVVHLAPAAGGASRVMEPRPPVYVARFPRWSPDGRSLLFWAQPRNTGGGVDWQVAAVETGDTVKTGAVDLFRQHGLQQFGVGEWWNDHILFSAGVGDSVALWKVSISPKTWQISQPPERLTFGTGREEQPSIAATGRLAFAGLNENIDIWSLSIDPNQARPRGELQRLTEDGAADLEPSISADGKQLVYRTNRGANWDMWLKDLETGRESPLTTDAAADTRPFLAASRVVYARAENQKTSIYLLDLSAGGRPTVPEKLCDQCGFLTDLSADGSMVLLYKVSTRAIVSVAVASRRTTILAQHPKYGLGNPRFSPDGRWIAFHTQPGPVTRQMFVAPVRSDGAPAPEADWIPITDGNGLDRLASWSPDGNVLYWISERDGWRCIAYRRLDPATKKPLGETSYVQHFHGARRSMMQLASTELCRLSIARDKIVFSLAERTGNIWMTELAK